MTRLAQLADSPGVDWLGLALAVGAVVAYFAGVDISAYDVLIGAIFAALGRGALITAKRKEQQKKLLDLAIGAHTFVVETKGQPVGEVVALPIDTEVDTSPIEVSHGAVSLFDLLEQVKAWRDATDVDSFPSDLRSHIDRVLAPQERQG